MKRLRAVLMIVFSIAIGCMQDATANVTTLTNKMDFTMKLENNNNMKTKLVAILSISALLLFGFQMAKAQEVEIYRQTQEKLDELSELKKEIESGKITKKAIDADPYNEKFRLVEEVLDPAQRETKIKSLPASGNEGEAKVLRKAYEDVLKLLSSKGIRPKSELETDPALSTVYNEIKETAKILEEFNPKTEVFTGNYNHIWNAISGKERARWGKPFFSGAIAKFKLEFDAALDELAAAFKKNASKLNPDATLFANHNAAEEALMKKQIPSTVKVHKIGIRNKDYEVAWDNTGKYVEKTPASQFKQAYIWGIDSAKDHGYCELYQVNLIKDYEGGGKYGPTYAKKLESWPRACPAK